MKFPDNVLRENMLFYNGENAHCIIYLSLFFRNFKLYNDSIRFYLKINGLL